MIAWRTKAPLVLLMLLAFLFVAQADEPENNTERSFGGSNEALPWTEGLSPGVEQAQLDGKPALVFVGGDSCVWCRRLKLEMQQDVVQRALVRWTLVYVDVEDSPDAASKLGVGPIPALRLLRATGTKVAAHDGFIPAAQLVAWLNDEYGAAAGEVDPLLADSTTPTLVSAVRLVRRLEDRDPLIREAAIRRLATAPQAAGPPLLEALGHGNLAARLAALEVFSLWEAPVAELDPWRPETLTPERLAALQTWQEQFVLPERSPHKPLTEQQREDAQAQIDRLLMLEPNEGAAIRARLARYGSALLPEVYARLKVATSDEARQRLTVLRYRLVASDSLVLQFPGGLTRLAATDAQLRRQAAQQLVKLTTPIDQPLLLELFNDPDPLIRETALRGLKELGGPTATSALVRLLKDPEPNVRAAVLKQLAEEAPVAMVGSVAAYAQTETDPDLLVHAIRFFRAAKGGGSLRALLPMLQHEAWQVRAEAAEALQDIIEEESRDGNSPLVADAYAALIKLLDDEDPFIVSRAIEAVGESGMSIAIKPLVDVANKYPQLAPSVFEALTSSSMNGPLVHSHLKKFAEHADPDVRSAAITTLYREDPGAYADLAIAGLQDSDSDVQVAVADAMFASLETYLSQFRDEFTRDPTVYQNRYLPSPLKSAARMFADALVGKFKLADNVPVAPQVAPYVDPQPSAPEDNRWDERLTQFYSGKIGPHWKAKAVPVLEGMLQSEKPDVQLVAARLLVPFGKADTGLPVLRTLLDKPGNFGRVAEVLPWLPWDKREELYRQLLDVAAEGQFAELAYSVSRPIDRHGIEILWELLESDKPLGDAAIGQINSALSEIQEGPHSELSEAPPEVRQAAEAELTSHLESDKDRVRLVAMIRLAAVNPEAALDVARPLADDEQAGERLRRVAFQLQLLAAPEEEQAQIATAALQGDDTSRQEMALWFLALGARPLQYLDEYHISLPISVSSTIYSQDTGPIIPTAPQGIAAADLYPLLDHANIHTRAYAGYLLALLGEPQGLPPLIDYWRGPGQKDYYLPRLVYRAIAKTNSNEYLPVLRELYDQLDQYDAREFYWTIRIMGGEDMLRFRKEIRDRYGRRLFY